MKHASTYQNWIDPSCSLSFGLYFSNNFCVYKIPTGISRNPGRKEENVCAILGLPALCTAKVLACVKAHFSFLSCCFPWKPFGKVKWSTPAAKPPCGYPVTVPHGGRTPQPGAGLAAWLGKLGTRGGTNIPELCQVFACASASILVLRGSGSGDGASPWAPRGIIIIHCGRTCLSCWAPMQKCS